MSSPERREQLLDTTKRLVLRDGFHAVSIEGVARAAGITRPIVYGHFGDLPGLLEALVERETTRALAQLDIPEPAEDEDLAAALLRSFSGYLSAAESDPDTWRLVLMPPEGAPESLRERIRVGREMIVAQLARLVRGRIDPSLRPPDPELAARLLSALSDEAIRLRLTDPAAYPRDRIEAQAAWFVANFSQP